MPEQELNEHRTRKEYIDKLLADSKWTPIVPFRVDGQWKYSGNRDRFVFNGAEGGSLFGGFSITLNSTVN